MIEQSRIFYETMYAEGRKAQPPGGFMGKMFRLMRRFELHRVSAAYSLLEKGEKMLDVGCGEGVLMALSMGNKYKEVYGIDVASVVIKRARRCIKERIGSVKGVNIKRASLDQRLPFKDGFFDAVTCIAVLEHIFDPYFSIGEIARVLKKKGILVLEVPNLVWLPRRLAVLFGKLPVTAEEEGWDGGHLHYFTFKATKDLLEQYGFKIEFSGSTGIFSKLRNIYSSLLGGNILIKARKIKNV